VSPKQVEYKYVKQEAQLLQGTAHQRHIICRWTTKTSPLWNIQL